MESKYLKRFQDRQSDRQGRLVGDRILIEILKEREHKTKGGIIIAESDHARNEYMMLRATIGIVLEVGAGYYSEGEEVPLDVQPGNIVWVSENGLRYCTTVPTIPEGIPEKTIALTTEGEVHKSWESLESYVNDTELMGGN